MQKRTLGNRGLEDSALRRLCYKKTSDAKGRPCRSEFSAWFIAQADSPAGSAEAGRPKSLSNAQL